MKLICDIQRLILAAVATLLLCLMIGPEVATGQEEVASALRRYKNLEVSTGYYEEFEVLPRRQRPFVEIPGVRQGLFAYSPQAAVVRNRSHLADSHRGIKFYERRRCESCHVEQIHNLHTERADLTCRQCHGGEPIASIAHYFSPMNPIRRHAYVCAKCHEGANASYAGYVVHAPNPSLLGTKATFPVLYYAFWIMIAIAILTFAVFLPHTVLWGVRELFDKKEKTTSESDEKE